MKSTDRRPAQRDRLRRAAGRCRFGHELAEHQRDVRDDDRDDDEGQRLRHALAQSPADEHRRQLRRDLRSAESAEMNPAERDGNLAGGEEAVRVRGQIARRRPRLPSSASAGPATRAARPARTRRPTKKPPSRMKNSTTRTLTQRSLMRRHTTRTCVRRPEGAERLGEKQRARECESREDEHGDRHRRDRG